MSEQANNDQARTSQPATEPAKAPATAPAAKAPARPANPVTPSAPPPSSSPPQAETRQVDKAKPAAQLPDGERVIIVVRPAMFRAHPFRYMLILVMFFGGLGLAIAAAISEAVQTWLAWPGLLLALFAALWFCQWWFITHLSYKLTVTNKRTTQRRGFFSRRISEVLHEHIRNVRIDQTLPQRILKVGHIRIDTAAGASNAEVEIDIHDIPDPHELKATIDPYRNM